MLCADFLLPIAASLSDLDTLEKYAAKSDVVVTAADCDDLPSAKAIIKGLESAAQGRLDSKQQKAVLIHTYARPPSRPSA